MIHSANYWSLLSIAFQFACLSFHPDNPLMLTTTTLGTFVNIGAMAWTHYQDWGRV